MTTPAEIAAQSIRSRELDSFIRQRIEVASAARLIRPETRTVLAETLAQSALRLASSFGLTDAQVREELGLMQGAWRFAQTLDTAIAASEHQNL